MSVTKTANTKAFGIEEGWTPFRLRQARYYELGVDAAAWAQSHHSKTGRKLDLLDVGTWNGVTRRYVEAHAGGEQINYHAVDIFPFGKEFVYKHEDWQLHHINLEQGLPGLSSERYDLVICEQVLEHLHQPQIALAEMSRVLRPGGRMILGVPIFPEGMHLIRKHVVPVTDKLFQVKKVRSHVQAWSKRTFVNLIRSSCPELHIDRARGFRIISGGILRKLEYHRWWWQFNRRLGALLPALCIEIQIIAHKKSLAGARPAARAA